MQSRSFLGLFLAAALLGMAAAPASARAAEPRVAWRTAFQAGMEEAIVKRRPMLVTFYTDWCGWCRKLEAQTFRDPAFVDLMSRMVPLRVNGDQERGLASMFRVSGYPTTVIVSRRGEELGRIVGYQPAEAFTRSVLDAMGRREPLEGVRGRVETNPRDPEALYAGGDVDMALGRYTEAEQAFRAVLALDPPAPEEIRAEAALDLALAVYLSGRAPTALPMFDAFLAEHPASPRRDQGLYFSGLALLDAGRAEEGRARLREAEGATALEYIKAEARRLVPGE